MKNLFLVLLFALAFVSISRADTPPARGTNAQLYGSYSNPLPTSSASTTAVSVDEKGRLYVAPHVGASTYSAAIVATSFPNSPTDVFTITGSATKKVIITKIAISGTQTTGGYANVIILKRSTANTGGTSTTLTAVPHESSDSAATATVRSYTANPTALGTLVGNLRAYKLPVTTATTFGGMNDPSIFRFGDYDSKGITLRSASEVLSINLNGVSLAGNNFNVAIEWMEE